MPRPELLTLDEFHKCKVTRDGRSNCILDTSKLSLYVRLASTEEAIKKYLVSYKSRLRKVR